MNPQSSYLCEIQKVKFKKRVSEMKMFWLVFLNIKIEIRKKGKEGKIVEKSSTHRIAAFNSFFKFST